MLLILAIVVLFVVTGAILFRRQSRRSVSLPEERIIPPLSNFTGLFNETNSEADEKTPPAAAEARALLLDRARQFDLTALDEANSDSETYTAVLHELINQTTGCQEKFLDLVGHVSKSRMLRANRELANRMIDIWKQSSNKRTTAQMLHIVALADDAALYQKSLESVLDYWEKGLLSGLSASNLMTLIESEYWVIDSSARTSGAGFALRDCLSDTRRRLQGK